MNEEEHPEFEADGQMNLLAAAAKNNKPEEPQPIRYINDWDIPAYLRQPNGRSI